MSEDKSVVKPVEAPPLTPLNIPSKLAPTPAGPLKYSVKVKNANGEEVILGDPSATRGLVALMDTEAVNGGAACHWGGPSAFAEIMASIHGIMFATKVASGTRPIILSMTPAIPKTEFMPCAAITVLTG